MPETCHITSSGGILTSQFIEAVRGLTFQHPCVRPETFALPQKKAPSQKEIDEALSVYWELLIERWDALHKDIHTMDVSRVRSRWLSYFFSALDFDLKYQQRDILLGEGEELRFSLSHRGWEGSGAPIVHTVAPTQGLDQKPSGQRLQKNPHDLLQLYLNVARDDTWAILSNGLFLRLLRTFHHTYTKGFVEFDLEGIFEARNFTDFRALYRLVHASRFIPNKDEVLPMEQFYKSSLAAGIAVGTNLQKQVLEAIETLANGFLSGEMMSELQKNEEEITSFYAEILYLIYRIIFLLFAEQRGLMPGRTSLYAGQYSITRLRDLAMRNTALADHHGDLWEGLKVTFRMLQKGVPELDIYGYNGMLFSIEKTPTLACLACSNTNLLRAIRCLTLIEKDKVLQRISYLDLGVEEIGSIYESLLEYTPRLSATQESIDKRTIPANRFFLDPRGTTRKTTGSYYTNPQLVNELIKSALVPIVRDRLEKAGLPLFPSKQGGDVQEPLCDYSSLTDPQKATGEKALLHIKVCDPACGSAPFLIAAVNMMGQELARIRTQDLYPAEKDVRRARRDVLTHCIYGVDINPMAVALAKVSLWIDCAVEDQPLNFLDHHIKWGNSLIGATPALLKKGIPLEAFTAVTGDDKTITAQIRKNHSSRSKAQNKKQKIQLSISHEKPKAKSGRGLAEQYFDLIEIPENSPAQVTSKQVEYGKLITSEEYLRKKREADFWTAAFFWPLNKEQKYFPTQEMFIRLRENPQSIDQEFLNQVVAIAHAGGNRFFHWHLEFPEVFKKGGFDVIIGNPPWEKMKLQEREFFAARAPNIANAQHAASRRKMITDLKHSADENDLELYKAYWNALRTQESSNKFVRNSQRFPLTGKGDMNTYALFAELAVQNINPQGYLGIIVKTGIASDDTTKDFFGALVDNRSITSFIDFSNKKGIFPAVVPNERFSLFTATGAGEGPKAFLVSVLNETIEKAQDHSHAYTITSEEIFKMNPNTKTCPLFFNPSDLKLCLHLYSLNPVLLNESIGPPLNPWNVEYYTMFHMTNDSGLFRDKEWLLEKNYILKGNLFQKDQETYLPLYEGKFFNLFDHRFGSFGDVPRTRRFGIKAEPNHPSDSLKSNPIYEIEPRYWVNRDIVLSEYARKGIPQDTVFMFRDVCRTFTDSRTARGTLMPCCAAGNTAPILIFRDMDAPIRVIRMILFTSIFSSFTFDFIVRQKISSAHLNRFTLCQIAVPEPNTFQTALEYKGEKKSAQQWIVQHSPILFCNTNAMLPFFMHIGINTITPWDPELRSKAICFIDAIIARMYGLTREEYVYILDCFPILRAQEMQKFGEFQSARLCLEYWDELRKG